MVISDTHDYCPRILAEVISKRFRRIKTLHEHAKGSGTHAENLTGQIVSTPALTGWLLHLSRTVVRQVYPGNSLLYLRISDADFPVFMGKLLESAYVEFFSEFGWNVFFDFLSISRQRSQVS